MTRITVRDAGEARTCEFEGVMDALEVLRTAGFEVDAPCGGAGTCKKCRMLIADGRTVEYRLACQTPAIDGLEVTIERSRAMDVSLGTGLYGRWRADGEAGAYGLAIDVGTTTLVMRLHELGSGEVLGALGRSNPQLAYGADVISRISACASGGLEAMTELLGDALIEMARELVKGAGIGFDDVRSAVLVGNTTMQHIAQCIDPTPLGASPFTPPTLFGDIRHYEPFARAGLECSEMRFAPCVAAYVGGDITAGLLACGMLEQDEPMLFLDLGTNGEMALGSRRGVVTCATAAGPVFEGANITYGMPAYPGAISRVRLGTSDGELALDVIGSGEGIGICGTGLFDICNLLLECGIVDETGRFVDEDEVDASVSHGLEKLMCEMDGQPAIALSARVYVTQKDVRNLQLAKASVCAGILTMLEYAGLRMQDVGDVLIAGGFGEYLDLDAAVGVGIFPVELRGVARSVGNTAIEGASAMLVASDAREELERIARSCEYIELSTSARFNELYVEQMMFE